MDYYPKNEKSTLYHELRWKTMRRTGGGGSSVTGDSLDPLTGLTHEMWNIGWMLRDTGSFIIVGHYRHAIDHLHHLKWSHLSGLHSAMAGPWTRARSFGLATLLLMLDDKATCTCFQTRLQLCTHLNPRQAGAPGHGVAGHHAPRWTLQTSGS